ncbi:hypothetical protein D9M73_204940 [compost metagenome]
MDLYLAISLAARDATGCVAGFAGTLRAARQTLVDIGVEVGGDGAGDLDVDLVAGFQLAEVFRLIGQLHMHLTTFRPFKHHLMLGGIDRNDFGADFISLHDGRQRNVFCNSAKAGGRQQGGEGDGFGQCVEFHRQNIPCDGG